MALRVLWAKTGLLHPVNTGGAIRTYEMLRQLRRRFEITFLTLSGPGMQDAEQRALEYCHHLECVRWAGAPPATHWRFYAQALANLRSTLPLALERYTVPALAAALRTLVARTAYDVLVCDFLFPAVHFMGLRGHPTILFQHNVETMIWERLARQSRGLARWYFHAQACRMRTWEGRLARQFDHVVVVSREDAAIMAQWFGVPDATVVPTGVDAAFYRPPAIPVPQRDVVFVGSLDWRPNIDGLGWFLDRVWPAVRARHPAARFHIVGRRPGRAVRRLASRRPGVELWADVPDVREYLWGAAVVVVPLRIGGGTRLKIYEALAAGCAVVATPVGAEGLEVQHGRHLLVHEDPSRFAAAVNELLADPRRCDALGEAARSYVARELTWNRAADVFAQACARVAMKQAVPA